MDATLILNEIQFIGGLAGDALDAMKESIANGLIEGFKYIVGCTAQVVVEIAEICIYAYEVICACSKDAADKSKMIKYILIRLGAGTIVKFVRLM